MKLISASYCISEPVCAASGLLFMCPGNYLLCNTECEQFLLPPWERDAANVPCSADPGSSETCYYDVTL